jgi:hypothetical protein
MSISGIDIFVTSLIVTTLSFPSELVYSPNKSLLSSLLQDRDGET